MSIEILKTTKQYTKFNYLQLDQDINHCYFWPVYNAPGVDTGADIVINLQQSAIFTNARNYTSLS